MAPRQGIIETADDKAVAADFSFLTTASVLFDAVYVPGGVASIEILAADADACHFVDEAYKHCKAICAIGGTDLFINNTYAATAEDDVAVIIASKPSEAANDFINAIAQHRNWDREKVRNVPA